MKSIVTSAIALGITVLAAPAPAPQDDPIRISPHFWRWDIVGLKGPGCPDQGSTEGFHTRENYGHNTVDGSEIYFQTFAYPYMRLKLENGQTDTSTWCETTLRYTELAGAQSDRPAATHRLRAHKNGTEVLAHYALDEGVQASWKFTYDFRDDEIIDKIKVNGPVTLSTSSDKSQRQEYTHNLSKEQYKMPECGTGTVKFRTDLSITADTEGKNGFVRSSYDERKEAKDEYGTIVGVSYDFEKCT